MLISQAIRHLPASRRAAYGRFLSAAADLFKPCDQFERRHIGPSPDDKKEMLAFLGFDSMEDMVAATVPPSIRLPAELDLETEGLGEQEALKKLKGIMSKNKVARSFIGQGYYETVVPEVIKRNMLENPGWYTAYTPYQAEISQGRLESLLNFQTAVCDLVGLPCANASLLDEATAAAEAMNLCIGAAKKRNRFFVDKHCHPQTIDLIKTRSGPVGVEVVIGDYHEVDFSGNDFAGAMVQYPNTLGNVNDFKSFADSAHASGTLVVACTDLLACTQLTPPGEWGADIAVGSAQRFGVPMGFGGPHAAFFACEEKFRRKMPGRMIGVSVDSQGNRALRMALQTREQHIRRDKATSNICTAQALLANMAAMYAVYHGPEGLKNISDRIHRAACVFKAGLSEAGYSVSEQAFFDTVTITVDKAKNGMSAKEIADACAAKLVNVRLFDENTICASFGETVDQEDVLALLDAFGASPASGNLDELAASAQVQTGAYGGFERSSDFLTHPIFEM
jgi:glycine dehydrogenase